MTPEELAGMSLDIALAEMRFFYEHLGSELHRYEKLRMTVYRAYLEHCDDSEWAAFITKRHGLFKEAAAPEMRLQEATALTEEPEMVAAMKRIHEKLEQGDS